MGIARKVIREWHTEILPRDTKRALDFLSRQKWLKRSRWYLAGGTALALYAGHRKSLDLDFFSPRTSFLPGTVTRNFRSGDWVSDVFKEGTIYGRIFGAKISFIAYPFFMPKDAYAWYGNVRILSPRDIAVMKIIAISQRGRKRDFIDLYWYARNQEPLPDVLRRLPEQYPTVAHDYHHILKSFLYFEDAEGDPMPKLNFDADWKTVKTYFRREVPRAAKELLRLEV
jgi:hypothetical protein